MTVGFLDDIKSRLPFGQASAGYGQDDYAQDGYDDYYEGDGYDDYAGSDVSAVGAARPRSSSEPSNGLLGQTHRGEAESVAVYTRSGQLVGDADRHAATYNPPARSQDAYQAGGYQAGAYDTPSSFAAQSRAYAQAAPAPAPTSRVDDRASEILASSPQLPAYILRPESYDDVETVVRRVRTKQPVALVFVGVRTEIAKRVLDFSYGFACGFGATVKEVGDRLFMVLPAGCEVKDSDLQKLRQQGYLK